MRVYYFLLWRIIDVRTYFLVRRNSQWQPVFRRARKFLAFKNRTKFYDWNVIYSVWIRRGFVTSDWRLSFYFFFFFLNQVWKNTRRVGAIKRYQYITMDTFGIIQNTMWDMKCVIIIYEPGPTGNILYIFIFLCERTRPLSWSLLCNQIKQRVCFVGCHVDILRCKFSKINYYHY